MLKWIYVYGPPRTGSTYLLRQIRNKAIHSVSDWGLGMILQPFAQMPGGIDKSRFLQDLAENLLRRSRKRETGEIDLVLKAANSNLEEFECYLKMFGPPQRIFFTIREPAGYMSSASKKFPDKKIDFLQASYLRMLALYPSIGGDVLNYSENLCPADYRRLLLPLNFEEDEIEPFEYRGTRTEHLVHGEMRSAYEEFLQKNANKVLLR